MLHYVPIIHTAADLGSQAEAIRSQMRARIGEVGLRRRDTALARMWASVRERLLRLRVEWARLRVYQDSLPVCGREMDIVRDLAAAGSQNHALLLELGGRGATIMGTEDPALLRRELDRVAELASHAAPVGGETIARLKEEGEQLLRARDGFIVRRIDETLEPGQVGIGFFGLFHRVNERLPADIEVRMHLSTLPLAAF